MDVLFKPTKVSELRKGIKLRQRRGDRYTYIYDAVDNTLKQMNKIRGRKAIVLFSDGYGAGTFSSAKDNLREAEENEALIYTVQLDTSFPTTASYRTKAADYMRGLAEITGGRYYQMQDIADLEKTFAKISEELSRQYSLGYYPKQLEAGQKRQVRQIKVKMRQPNLVVRARRSYVVEPQKNSK